MQLLNQIERDKWIEAGHLRTTKLNHQGVDKYPMERKILFQPMKPKWKIQNKQRAIGDGKEPLNISTSLKLLEKYMNQNPVQEMVEESQGPLETLSKMVPISILEPLEENWVKRLWEEV